MDYNGKRPQTVSRVFEVEEIFIDILLRLPVKSLVAGKIVCKQWGSLIGGPSFMNLHLTQSQQDPSYVWWWKGKYLVTKIDGEESPKRFPGCDGRYFTTIVCSFNGLICGSDVQKRLPRGGLALDALFDIYICNPATGEVVLLPRAPGFSSSEYLSRPIGVSFGPTINGYKVFQFFRREGGLHECNVYSSMAGSWKSVGTLGHVPFSSQKHACIDGTVYWFGLSNSWPEVAYILSVDVEEKFSTIRLPMEKTPPFKHIFLIDLEGCLSLVAVDGLDHQIRFDLWTLQDSKECVWLKKLDGVPIPRGLCPQPLRHVGVLKNELLFASFTFYLFYNMRTETWKKLDWVSTPAGCRNVFSEPLAYTKSLLPCNGRVIE